MGSVKKVLVTTIY